MSPYVTLTLDRRSGARRVHVFADGAALALVDAVTGKRLLDGLSPEERDHARRRLGMVTA